MVAIHALTMSRVVLVLLGFFVPSDEYFLSIATWGGFTDFLDGFLARHFNLTSKFGAQLDQLSDKIFHAGVFAYLLSNGIIHFYFIALFLLRELLIVAMRQLNISQRASNYFGKLKTFLIYTIVIFLLANRVFIPEGIPTGLYVISFFEVIILIISYYSLLVSVRITSFKQR